MVQVASQPPPTNTHTAPYSQIIAFGDTLTDIGNHVPIGKEAVAKGEMSEDVPKWFETYQWEGRYSNGPLAVEILAEQLGVELKDYAIMGARSGYDNALAMDSFKNTGLLGQIDKYIADLNGEKADPEALYFLQELPLDYFDSDYSSQALTDRADQVVANFVTAVTALANVGAKKFLVGKFADLSRSPLILSEGSSAASTFQNRMDTTLVAEMAKLEQQLNIKIDLFDYTALNDLIWNNPAQYGFTNLTDQCGNGTTVETITVCETPDEYYWWNDLYPSRRAHQVIGEAMADQLSK
jgi:phospholipase/lecithinase/hemolysin